VRDYLLAQPDLNLTNPDNAGMAANTLFMVELLPPPKADALAALDDGAPAPPRQARPPRRLEGCLPRGARASACDGRPRRQGGRRGRRGAGARGALPYPNPDTRRRAPQAKATVYVGAEQPPRVAELAVGPLPAPGNHSLLRALAWDLRPPTRMEYSLCAPRCPAVPAGARARGRAPCADRHIPGPVHRRARAERGALTGWPADAASGRSLR